MAKIFNYCIRYSRVLGTCAQPKLCQYFSWNALLRRLPKTSSKVVLPKLRAYVHRKYSDIEEGSVSCPLKAVIPFRRADVKISLQALQVLLHIFQHISNEDFHLTMKIWCDGKKPGSPWLRRWPHPPGFRSSLSFFFECWIYISPYLARINQIAQVSKSTLIYIVLLRRLLVHDPKFVNISWVVWPAGMLFPWTFHPLLYSYVTSRGFVIGLLSYHSLFNSG
jgi:hypothetical protein